MWEEECLEADVVEAWTKTSTKIGNCTGWERLLRAAKLSGLGLFSPRSD